MGMTGSRTLSHKVAHLHPHTRTHICVCVWRLVNYTGSAYAYYKLYATRVNAMLTDNRSYCIRVCVDIEVVGGDGESGERGGREGMKLGRF